MPLDAEEIIALADTALRPARPQLPALLAHLSGLPLAACGEACSTATPWDRVVSLSAARGGRWLGHTSPAEAWEAVAPREWVDAPQRAFLRDLRGVGGDRGSVVPEGMREGLSVAADPAGVEAAECVARELVGALGLLPQAMAVLWCAVDVSRWRARCLGQQPDDALDGPRWRALLPASLGDEPARLGQVVLARCGPRLGSAAHDVATVAQWAAYGALRGDDAPRWIAPLFHLWSLGYALHALRPEALVLVAPRV